MILGLLLSAWDRFGTSMGSLLRHIGVTLGVLGSFMKHLGHQNRKKDVYDGVMWHITNILGHLGVMWGSLLGGFGALWGDCGVSEAA